MSAGAANVLYGPEGLQFKVWTSTNRPDYRYGQRLILQDGREYRFCKNGAGAATVVGSLYSALAPVSGYQNMAVQAAAAIGARTVSITNGATAITADQFAEGYLNVEGVAAATYAGYLYKISGNDAEGAGNATFTVSLAAGHGLRVALTTASKVGTIVNPFQSIVINPTAPISSVLGVATSVIAASGFGWLQVRGPASVLTDGTVIVGCGVMQSDGTAGAVEHWVPETDTANEVETVPIGNVLKVSATTIFSIIDLRFLN